MIRRNTIVVLVIFLFLLGAVIYINQDPGIQTSMGMITATPTEQPKLIGDYSIETIEKMTFTGMNNVSIEINKTGENKWVTANNEPVSVAAWFSIFQYINTLQSSGTLDGNVPLEKIGLSPPQSKIVLVDKQGKTSTLLIGNQTASASAYYVKWNDDPIAMVANDAIGALTSAFTLENLLEPTPAPAQIPTLTTE
jgi:hypothetical protein